MFSGNVIMSYINVSVIELALVLYTQNDIANIIKSNYKFLYLFN